jgi:hypothetical protein
VDTSGGNTRLAPPALIVAMAVGLGSMDMPIPQVAAWEWVNWKFPKAVKAGETIYARWTLTQKRPPVHGAPAAIAVWRVDVHTADGAVCAEGEIGASVFRRSASSAERAAEPGGPGTPARRRRRRRASAAAEPTPAAAPQPAPAERTGTPRRRRRRRPSGSSSGNGESAPAPAPPDVPAPAPSPQPVPVAASSAASPLSRVMRRLRRT